MHMVNGLKPPTASWTTNARSMNPHAFRRIDDAVARLCEVACRAASAHGLIDQRRIDHVASDYLFAPIFTTRTKIVRVP